jgi:hypothetical protein
VRRWRQQFSKPEPNADRHVNILGCRFFEQCQSIDHDHVDGQLAASDTNVVNRTFLTAHLEIAAAQEEAF